MWLSEETLTVEALAEPLAYHTVKVTRQGELTAVTEPRLVATRYQGRQPRLWSWAPNAAEWQPSLRVPTRRWRRHRRPEPVLQGRRMESDATG